LVLGKEREEESMVHNNHLSIASAALCLLKETIAAADELAARAGFRADVAPDVGREVEGERFSLAGGCRSGPLLDVLKLGRFRHIEQLSLLLESIAKTRGAEVISSSFEDDCANISPKDFSRKLDVLAENLLLKILGVCRDDCLALVCGCVEESGDKVCETFSNACWCFNDQVSACCKRFGHGAGHCLLLRSEVERIEFSDSSIFGKQGSGCLEDIIHDG
jgi:hypothetical protein